MVSHTLFKAVPFTEVADMLCTSLELITCHTVPTQPWQCTLPLATCLVVSDISCMHNDIWTKPIESPPYSLESHIYAAITVRPRQPIKSGMAVMVSIQAVAGTQGECPNKLFYYIQSLNEVHGSMQSWN